MKYLIQLVQQVDSIETILSVFKYCYRFLSLHQFLTKYDISKVKGGRYVTLSHLKKTIIIEIDIEENLIKRARKSPEIEHSEQDFKHFTEKLDLLKEEMKSMKNEFSNKLDLVMEHLMASKNQQF